MMYQEFVTMAKEEMQRRYPNLEIMEKEVTKQNGVEKIGLVFLDESKWMSPVIYLEELYCFSEDMEYVYNEVQKTYEETLNEEQLDVKSLFDYERIKSKIVFQLINREKNELFLKNVPFVPFLDMAIIFVALLNQDGNEERSLSMLVREDMMKKWNLNISELYSQAKENTKKVTGIEFKKIGELLKEMMDEDIDLDESKMLYCLTNRHKSHGASLILYPEVLEEIAEKVQDDFFVIPSSVHECLILPVYYAPPRDYVENMVKDINRECVDDTEILSDHVYYYSRKQKTLTM